MSNNIEYKKDPNNGKSIAGVILLVVGAVLLFRQLDFFFFPGWLFGWYWFLILPGLYIGLKSNFQKPTWFILVLMGFVFMAKDALSASDGIIWPVAFIIFGIWMILRRNNKYDNDKWQKFENGFKKKQPAVFQYPEPVVDYTVKDETADPAAAAEQPNPTDIPPHRPYGDDSLNATAIFGGVDKIILSKNFKGGDIVNIFGGTELDFTKADIDGYVVIEITQVFGGTKLIVPPHWHVISDMASIFASVDDKRKHFSTAVNNDKVLVIKGVSIFAGVDIRSY
ncbi:MAG: LiaF domain-containing protein [Mucilaginibacter sp.]